MGSIDHPSRFNTVGEADRVEGNGGAMEDRGCRSLEEVDDCPLLRHGISLDTEPGSSDEEWQSDDCTAASVASPPSKLHNLPAAPITIPNPSRYGLDTKLWDAYMTAGAIPPVTRDSLSELDIVKIINNTKLRHDINFDRELHFRPNLDGDKGRRKMQLAELYWDALLAELILRFKNDDVFPSGFIRRRIIESETNLRDERTTIFQKSRLGKMFESIGEILKTLVPERDHQMIDDMLDGKLLMQQVDNKVCDFITLSQRLSRLLKMHCAPMRDEWADHMAKQIEHGVRDLDMNTLVEGLKTLFGTLEAMKLDVANHQIRSLRPLLINDTINFEQKYFSHKIANARIDLAYSELWFMSARNLFLPERSKWRSNGKRQHLSVFFSALVRMLYASSPLANFPQTFIFDYDRLRHLRGNFHDAVCLEICHNIFTRVCHLLGNLECRSSKDLRDSIVSIVGHGNEDQKWERNIPNVAAEIVRHAYRVFGEDTSFNSDFIVQVEGLLAESLDSRSGFYTLMEAEVGRTLWPILEIAVESNLNLSPLDVFDTLNPSKEVGSADDEHSREGLGRRVAHAGLLHWRVWADLLYSRLDLKSADAVVINPTDVMGGIINRDARFNSFEAQQLFTPPSSPSHVQEELSLCEDDESMEL
ncbi:MAG: hypothetical protein M1819_006573 [Sarea resinae]|nr:MAG: hypothetical protein M1819_006573 [Sarea resinae]